MKCRLPRANIQCFVDGHFFSGIDFLLLNTTKKKKQHTHTAFISCAASVMVSLPQFRKNEQIKSTR